MRGRARLEEGVGGVGERGLRSDNCCVYIYVIQANGLGRKEKGC